MAIRDRLQTVRKTRLYEGIVSQITALILEGDLKVGDRLPSERELCERFGVGRNSVREAVRALESANLVATRHGDGTFVVASPESLVPVLSERTFSEGESGLHQLFEARRLLEPQIAALAAERATAGEMEKLADILERQRAEVQRGRSGMDEDTAFHLGLAEAAKNEFLLRLVSVLLSSLKELRERSIREKVGRLRSLHGHEEILKAVQAREGKRAVSRMLSHILEIEGREMDGAAEEDAEIEAADARLD
jgi:GntR family transcriptional repressor for pyruvate dehydrogenase complex